MFFVMRALQATADNMGDSLRNKRFQSSDCTKVGARAKEMDMILFFTRVSANFLDEQARKRLLRNYIGA